MLTLVYPSSYKEWELVECIVGIMFVIHAHIGVLQYEGRSNMSLANEGIFFYDHFYDIGKLHQGGRLIPLPLTSDWNYIDWPVPDFCVLELIRSKLFKDVQRSLRVAIPTKNVKLSMYCPITVFVELFGSSNIHIAKTLLLCKNPPTAAIFDNGWKSREAEGIQCDIAEDTMLAKYMLATQTLIVSYW